MCPIARLSVLNGLFQWIQVVDGWLKSARVRAKQRFNSNGIVVGYNQIIESKKAD